MLMKSDVASEFQKVADLLVAANPSVVAAQPVVDLFRSFDEIAELRTRLERQLNSLAEAIQRGQPAALATNPELREHVKKAIVQLESGGEGSGVGDRIRH